MPSTDTILIFTAAAVLMNISPGPSNFYVMSRSIAQGRRGGAVAALGLATGTLVHVAAAALGLSVVFHYHPAAYQVVKLAGAAYLIYLGARYLLGSGSISDNLHDIESRSVRRIFVESIFVEIMNPKTALFFLAFLPQFVDLSRGGPAPQILVLGAIVTLSAIPCDLLVACTSSAAAKYLKSHPRFMRIQAWTSGSILVGLGLYVAFAKREV